MQNDSLGKIEPPFIDDLLSLLAKVFLLDKLPPLLTRHAFSKVNIMSDLSGHVAGAIYSW
jgi:hypothetical protein